MGLRRAFVLGFTLLSVLLMIACGNSSKPITVAVTPSISSTTIAAGSSAVTLSATVANDSKNGGVTWTLSPSSGCGTLSGSGSSATYTPPSAATLNSDCTATITATSASDSSKVGTVALTIKAISVSVASSSGTTTTFGSGAPNVTLTATLNNEASGASDTVTWSITSTGNVAGGRIVHPQVAGLTSNCGTLVPNNTTAVYTAPTSIASQCTATITAASTINSHQTKTTTFTVNPIAVTIPLASPVTEFADQGPIAVTATITNDGGNAGLHWTVTGCGSVNGTATGAIYTPPAAPAAQCTAVVTAASVTDPSKSASAPTFTINPIVAVAVNGSGTLAEGATTNVTATVTNDLASPSGVTWAVSPSSCGSVTGTGLSVTYNTPVPLASSCTATVTATSNADPTKSNHATIAVSPTSVSITSPSGAQNLPANGGNVTVQAAFTNDGSGQGITWSMTSSPASPACGTLTPSGTSATYAPPTESGMSGACTATVKAASTADSQHNSTVAITENPVSLSTITGAPSQGVAQGSAAIPLYTTPANDATNSGVIFVLTAGASCGSLGPVHPSGASYYADFTPAASVTANCVATIQAESVYDNNREQQVSITVLPLTVTITSPANNTSVTVNTIQAVTASVSNDVGGGNVTWSLTPATGCGTLTSNGTGVNYNAPGTPGCTATVKATAVDDTSKFATVTLNVVSAPISVGITPQGPYGLDASNSNGQSQLNLTGTIQNDVNSSGLSWSVDNPSCGSIVSGLSGGVPGGMATFTAANDSGMNANCVTNIIATSVYDNTKKAQYQATVYPITVNVTPNGQQTVAPGGQAINFTATVNNDAVPGPGTATSSAMYWGVGWTFLNGVNNCGTLTVLSHTSATYTPPASGSCQVTLQALSDADNNKYVNTQITVVASTPLVINTTQDKVNTGLAGLAYTLYIQASGGSGDYGNYQFTYSGLPSWLQPVQNSSELTGTPTAAGSWPITVSVKDTVTNQTAGPVSLTINISAGPDGAHNSYLNGRYTCLLNGFIDLQQGVSGMDGSRWASLVTFVADGSGHITSGAFNGNGRTLGLTNGTFTGTYSVDTSNNALFKPSNGLVKSGISSPLYIMTLNKVSGPTADTVRLVEADDLGANPSGLHGGGVCYLTNASAFINPVGGNFVLTMGGEDPGGVAKGTAGVLSISGTSISAVLDQQHGIQYQNQTGTGSLTSAMPDTTGALTATLGTNSYKMYVVDSNRMLLMMYDANKLEAESGQMRKQQQASYSMSNMQGPLVVYENSLSLDPTTGVLQGYGTMIAQGVGSGSGSSGTLTFHTSAQSGVDASQTTTQYTVNDPGNVNQAMPITVGSNGRVVITTGSTGGVYVYLYDNNTAAFLDASAGGGGSVSIGLGWAEPQTGSMTDNAIAGGFMFGNLPALNVYFNDSVGVVNVSSTAGINGTSSDAWQGGFDWMSPIPSGVTYNWDSNLNTATSHTYGYYGLIDINQGDKPMNCIAIKTGSSDSTNKFVCVQESDSPGVMVMQQ